MARRAPGAALLVAFVVAACNGEESDSNRPVRTLIAFTKIGDPEPGEIWTAHADGTGQRRLVRGVGPAVSPDGRWISFHRCGHVHCDLWLIAATGGKAQLLARRIYDPKWSGSSNRIVGSRVGEVEGQTLLVIDPQTGRENELARGSLWGWSVSPSGDEVVYGLGRGRAGDQYFARERVDLYIVDLEGGEARRLTDDGRSGYPVWGPEAIAFSRLIPYRGWGRHEIWQIEPDGEGRRTITGPLPRRLRISGATGLVPVAWSEDGASLLAKLWDEFGGSAYTVDPKTGATRKIGSGFYAEPAGLSRDGRFVLLVEGGGAEPGDRLQVVIAPYRGGRAKLVAKRSAGASWNR